MSDANFHALRETGLIAVEGDDAVSFLHAQLTSDVAGLGVCRTQYSGYCSPNGRLLATVLIWRLPDRILLQLPLALSESIRARLAKFVLRAKLRLTEASAEWTLFGISGPDAGAVVASAVGTASIEPHNVATAADLATTRLSGTRYLILAPSAQSSPMRAALTATAREQPESSWEQLDIAAGVPWIVQRTQDEYIPQMVNLDLLGAVSFNKGCYPGQEIVARTHYRGRVKQRMHHMRVRGEETPLPGDPLYSALFGADQASGTLVNVAPHGQGGHDALAVIQTAALGAGSLHWKSPHGPLVELLSLPYTLPA